MATSSNVPPPAGSDSSTPSTADIREGFLCPICMCDLRTFSQLSVHFDTAHGGEDQDAITQLKELFGNVKKKIKIKTYEKGGNDASEVGSNTENVDHSAVDVPPIVWEDQTMGQTHSHSDAFKKFRDERNSHAAIQRNKLVIRLKKLIDPSAPIDAQRRKEYEKSLVRWAPDEDVPLCPFCAATLGPPGGFGQTLKNLATKSGDDTPTLTLKELKDKLKLKQILGMRRHHCRTCGAVTCHDCSFFLSFSMGERLVDVITRGNESESETPFQECKETVKAIRRSESNSSLNSMAAFEGELYVRICRDCWTCLESRFRYLESLHAPHPVAPLYRALMRNLAEIEVECPSYVDMARALHRGEQTFELDQAGKKRNQLMKLFEGVDLISKKIAACGKTQSTGKPASSEKQLKLQRVIRLMSANFMQDYAFGLLSLPTPEEYERLKEKRQKELLREIEAQRRAELKASRMAGQMDVENVEGRSQRPTDLSLDNQSAAKEGWLPAQVRTDEAEEDPLVQQIGIIKGYIDQAKLAGKKDEVKMLRENLRDLELVVRKNMEERNRKEWGETKVAETAGDETVRCDAENDRRDEDRDYPSVLNPFAEEE